MESQMTRDATWKKRKSKPLSCGVETETKAKWQRMISDN
jgi:hypothetical protein